MAGIVHNVWCELGVQACHIAYDTEILLRENPPRSNGKLHHRHERMYLRRPYDEGLVELVGRNAQEGCPLPATNHIGASISIAEHARRSHTRNERLHCRPRIIFVAKTLHERLSAHLPTCTVFVERERETYLRPRSGVVHVGGKRVESAYRCGGVTVVVARIELESIDTELGLHVAELCDEMCCSIGIGEVIAGGISIPPVEDSSASVGILQEVAFGGEVAVFRRVGRHKRTYPQHDAETEVMKFVHHGFRVGETLCLEVEIAVVALPVVVNHQDSGGEAVVDDGVCIAQDVLLILVVHQFYPCVVLGHGEEQRIGQQPRSRKILGLCGKVCLSERAARTDGGEGIGGVYLAVLGGKNKRTIRPHIRTIGRQKERYELIVLVLHMEVESRLVGIGLVSTETHGRTPPVLRLCGEAQEKKDSSKPPQRGG